VYLPYQILRSLGPQSMTAAQQREADELLGSLVAGMARPARPDRKAAACGDSGAGQGGRIIGQISKSGSRPAGARRGARTRRAAGARRIVRPGA